MYNPLTNTWNALILISKEGWDARLTSTVNASQPRLPQLLIDNTWSTNIMAQNQEQKVIFIHSLKDERLLAWMTINDNDEIVIVRVKEEKEKVIIQIEEELDD